MIRQPPPHDLVEDAIGLAVLTSRRRPKRSLGYHVFSITVGLESRSALQQYTLLHTLLLAAVHVYSKEIAAASLTSTV